MLGRMVLGLGRLGRGLAFALVSVLAACSGKSDGDDDDDESEGNGVATRLETSGVDKVDLLFMIDNSISMADKQRLLVEAVPVLVSRLIDPICVDGDGNPVGGTNSTGCAPNTAEFAPIEDMHIGIITSSLGNHGGDICTPDPMEMPPRPLNDSAQLIASVRTGVYSYGNSSFEPSGFLVWDPRVGDDRPAPDPHTGLTVREQDPNLFVEDFAAHVQAAGERGCGYEASLEAWYRFLIDPEPINQVTRDPGGQFSVRGPINPVVLAQRSAFLRPDSLLAIIMLTDENDCSIDDEQGNQGWLATRNLPMPRGSDACSHPEDPNIYRCCIACPMLDSLNFDPPSGCSYAADVSCGQGHELMPIEDSANLRCYRQATRFGIDLLYPWQRYAEALKAPRIELRTPDQTGNTEVQNPIYTPGADGTPARDPSKVFLAGIIGVPWQDIATGASLQGPGLEYLTAEEMTSPPSGTLGGNRWDIILGDPDTGRLPTDPFMHETVDPRSGANPITGDMIMPPSPGNTGNDINGHEQNVVNRDDLQYACTFALEPDVPCDMANQDGCACNASEEAYNRSLCRYTEAGTDGVQTHAKAYPGIRHLQVLKEFGDNSIIASICPKNPIAPANPASDPDYGYNPAMAAIVAGVKGAMGMKCLPRPIATNSGSTDCTVVEARLTDDCSCTAPGRGEVPSRAVGAAQDGLIAAGLCGAAAGVSCSDYCLCEIEELAGSELAACQSLLVDPETAHGFCYIDPEQGHGIPQLVAHCPATQQQLIRFMGDDVPAPGSVTFLSCPSDPHYDATHPPPL